MGCGQLVLGLVLVGCVTTQADKVRAHAAGGGGGGGGSIAELRADEWVRFQRWLAAGGAVFEGVQVGEIEGYGRGLVAQRDLGAGAVPAAVPDTLVLDSSAASRSPSLAPLFARVEAARRGDGAGGAEVGALTRLAALLLHERLRLEVAEAGGGSGAHAHAAPTAKYSHWAPLVAMLRAAPMETPLLWPAAAVRELAKARGFDGLRRGWIARAARATAAFDALAREAAAAAAALGGGEDAFALPPPGVWPVGQAGAGESTAAAADESVGERSAADVARLQAGFLWALSVAISRSVCLPETASCHIAPVLSLANHRRGGGVFQSVRWADRGDGDDAGAPAGRGLLLRRPVAAGEQVFADYEGEEAPRCGIDLVWWFGFAPRSDEGGEERLHDCAPITVAFEPVAQRRKLRLLAELGLIAAADVAAAAAAAGGAGGGVAPPPNITLVHQLRPPLAARAHNDTVVPRRVWQLLRVSVLSGAELAMLEGAGGAEAAAALRGGAMVSIGNELRVCRHLLRWVERLQRGYGTTLEQDAEQLRRLTERGGGERGMRAAVAVRLGEQHAARAARAFVEEHWAALR